MSDYQDYIGKHLLVGITFVDQVGELIEQIQTHGTIVRIDDKDGIVIKKADGSGLFHLPPQPNSLEPTPGPGEYKLHSTGEVVIDPDFTTFWTVEKTRSDTIDVYKRKGFGPFNSHD